MGFSEKIKNNRKTAIAIAVLLAAIAVAFFAIFLSGPSEKENEDAVSVTATADNIHMERKLTAAGKVTAGENDALNLAKGKILKAVCVSKNEGVKKGYALAYYTDGTHTDAPSDGIVAGIHTPENGETITDSHSIKFSNTRELYLRVTVPENEINNVRKGDTAQIVINAKPHEKLSGKIVEKKDVSTTMINELRSEKQTPKEKKEPEEERSGEDESVEEDEDSDDQGNSDDEEDASDPDGGGDGEEAPEDAEGEEDNGTVYYSVDIRFANDSTIRPGMSASCIINVSSRDDVLAVPIESVSFDDEGKPFVYRENGGDKEATSVKLGSSDAMNVEIKSGLKKGDKITYDKH